MKSMQPSSKVSLSVVVSVYNEDEMLAPFYHELLGALHELGMTYEIIFVNDGSEDDSARILADIAGRDRDVKVINLSKNFGHEAAMLAGIDHSSGTAVICMDADLQHPPSSIRELYAHFLNGYEVVNAVRKGTSDAAWFRRLFTRLFYNVLNRISYIKFEPNASDFFLISQRVASLLKDEFRERARFIRGYIQMVGFKRTMVSFVAPRRIRGSSKYSIVKLMKLSVLAIATFSNLPLRLGIMAGVIVGLFSLGVGAYSVVMKIIGRVPPGYTTIVVLISFLFAVQFFVIGIIGEYLSLIFDESKKRPIYITSSIISHGVDHERTC
jgi:dolichol-phosphate mannosyltransferase